MCKHFDEAMFAPAFRRLMRRRAPIVKAFRKKLAGGDVRQLQTEK